MVWTLVEVERAVRAAWGADTCAPEDLPQWSTSNPARGQCGVTALVLHDLFGGHLMRGEVRVDDEWVDYHWWNLLGEDVEVDLTREQFAADEIVGPGVVIVRGPLKRMREQYELLHHRVLDALATATA
ncbi:hypothetical protein [Saccharopolyspora gloriosae]|uniref:YunG family protein n=1 Tax=Saccharopolyspora gloriosae TaxID=455344 RepID=UPI001FB584A6|nr:hypothetical protein [Saccharopolyspora gloriosae]